MPSVGTAHVTVKVNTKGFTAELDRMMARVSRGMEKHGRDMGMQFNKGLSAVNPGQFFDRFERAADTASKNAANSLGRVGKSFDAQAQKALDSTDFMRQALSDVGDQATQTGADIRSMGTNFTAARNDAQGLSSAIGGIGSGGGGGAGIRSAADSFGFFGRQMQQIADIAPRAQAQLSSLFYTAAFGGTALAGLVGTASAAVQGIFALASQAVAAAPALVALGNAGLGLTQVFGAIGIGSAGVGEAIKAGFEAAGGGFDTATSGATSAARSVDAAGRSVESAARSIQSAARGVRDAREALRDAFQAARDAADDAADAAEDAARRVIAAERDVADAQREVRSAQLALNAARAEGMEQLEDIAFAAEDAALGEERATMALEEAYLALQQVQSLPPDDRGRRETELAYKEAELNLRMAKDRRQDADKEQTEAAKKGVRGTEAMQSAYSDLESAQESLRDSQIALNEARRDEAEVAEDNARRLRDAQEGIADAQQRLADSQVNLANAQQDFADSQDRSVEATQRFTSELSEAEKAQEKFEESLRGLAPAQQAFVRALVDLRPRLMDARREIAQPLFEGLLDALRTMKSGGFFDVVVDGLAGTSQKLGEIAARSAETVNGGVFSDRFAATMETNNRALGIFGRAGDNMLRLLNNMLFAAQPLIKRFAEWTKTLTAGWLETRRTKDQVLGMRDGFVEAANRGVVLFDFLKSLWRVTRTLGTAAVNASERYTGLSNNIKGGRGQTVGFVPRMTEALTEFDKKLNKPRNFQQLERSFDQALQNMEASAKAAKNAILDPIITMGQDPRIEEAMAQFSGTDSFDKLAENALDALPALSELTAKIIDALAVMSESGSITVFLETLNSVADAVGWAATKFGEAAGPVGDFIAFITPLNSLDNGTMLGIAGAAIGIYKALKLVKRIAFGLFGGIFGDVRKIPRAMGSAGRAVKSGGKTISGQGRGIARLFMRDFSGGLNASAALAEAGVRKVARSVRRAFAAPQTQARRDGTKLGKNFTEGIESAIRSSNPEITRLMQRFMTTLRRNAPLANRTGLSIGKNFGTGIRVGINTSIPGIRAAGANAGKAAAAAMRRALGVRSPSTVTMAVGRQTAAGMALGIRQGTPAVAAAGAQMGATAGRSAGAAVAGGAAKNASKFAAVGKVLGGAARGLGGAMNFMLGPWGLLITILLPLIMPLLTKLNDKFKITEKIVDGVQFVFGKLADAAIWVKDKVVAGFGEMVDWFSELPGKIGGFFGEVWANITGAVQSVIDWVKDNWKLILGILTGPIGAAVIIIFSKWDKILRFIKKIPGRIKAFLKGMWNVVTDKLGDAYNGALRIWGKVVTWVKGRPEQFKTNLRLLWSVFSDKLSDAWDTVGRIWDKVVTWVKGRPAQFKTNLKALWDAVGDRLSDAWDRVKNIWDRIKDWVGRLPGQIKGKLADLWDGLKSGFADAARWVVGKMQSWLINPLNKVLDKFGAGEIQINLPTIPAMATGGWVRGPGGPTDDRVLRRLSNKEYVLPARSATKIGQHDLEYMRRYGKLPDTGGLWDSIKAGGSWIKGGITAIGDALANGAKFALEWVISRFATKVPDNIFGDMFVGGLKWAASKFNAFGKDLDETATGTWTYPVGRKVPISQWANAGHRPPNAIDFDGDFGDSIRAAAGGSVASVERWTTSYGNHIILQHANGIRTLYAHLEQILVKVGQNVRAGQRIGTMGSTGRSTGSHLHFEVNPSSDSAAFLRKMGVRLASGGVVKATDGGVLSVIAEAGQHERVEPLDSDGMSKRDRVLLEMIRSLLTNAQGGDTWNIHPAPGMNETEFAKQVKREVVFHRRRGA